MKERFIFIASLLFMATPFCYANGNMLTDSNSIIVILLIVVVALIAYLSNSKHKNRIICQRNEQLRRILTALDDYRAIVSDESLSLDEQEEILKTKLSKSKNTKAVPRGGEQTFFVKMDARVNKEKPFTDPDFDQDALIKFMGVDYETFCQLVPRYTDPDRTLDYINSLRAEYAAKILMEHSDFSMDDIACQCGFTDTAAFSSAFKLSFGITPTDYLGGMSRMFKKQ